MDLYLIRHGPAAEPDPRRPGGDARRPLTNQGKKRMRRSAQGMARLGMRFNRILTSPLLRALQTAAILGLRLGVRPRRIVKTDLLLPDADPGELWPALRRCGRAGATALVGHEPHLSRLLARLLSDGGDGPAVEMKKGAVARVRIAWSAGGLPRARLIWLIPARVFRNLS